MERIKEIRGQHFTRYTFQAIAWKHKLKEDKRYCWEATEGVLVRYSNDVIQFVQSLSEAEVNDALANYRDHIRDARDKNNEEDDA